MGMFTLSRLALTISAAAALLAACGGSQALTGAPGATPQSIRHAAASYRVLYSFDEKDGANPLAGLTDVDGVLYGTTADGGSVHTCNAFLICGTAFRVTTDGAHRVLHNFGKRTDGYNPQGELIDVGGTLYGTTYYGGAYGSGTVFSITTGGKERVLHSFGSGTDGANPAAGLIEVNGSLYGTTQLGGASGLGTVYTVSESGAESVVYNFAGPRGDGAHPLAGLISVKGTLYGTTYAGGKHDAGTVFGLSTSGTERVLHSFASTRFDGIYPEASLLDVKGTLYGTTAVGGKYSSGGTVFSITTTGKEHVLHSFARAGSKGDGTQPLSSLINVNGTLYGTTVSGGEYKYGAGTVFSISTAGKEQVLHSFSEGTGDGWAPYAGLIDVNGTLYGTTGEGGTYGYSSSGFDGLGTVFAISL